MLRLITNLLIQWYTYISDLLPDKNCNLSLFSPTTLSNNDEKINFYDEKASTGKVFLVKLNMCNVYC